MVRFIKKGNGNQDFANNNLYFLLLLLLYPVDMWKMQINMMISRKSNPQRLWKTLVDKKELSTLYF